MNSAATATGRLAAYLARVGADVEPVADIETLRILHRQHPLAISFENISTVLGEPVPIDDESVFEKLVTRGRGGYCFEQNALLRWVLEQIGFDVTPLAARVVWSADAGHENPRTHMLLLVRVGGKEWLADVGFGGATLTAPVEFAVGAEQSTPHERVRLISVGAEYELQIDWQGSWRAMYQFDRQPQRPIDYEALNHYVATHPRSHFRTTLMAGRALPTGRIALLNGEFLRMAGNGPPQRNALGSAETVCQVLRTEFGIELSGLDALPARIEALLAD